MAGRTRVRSCWWAAAGAVAVIGCTAALLTTPPSALLASVLVFSLASLLFLTGVRPGRAERAAAGGPGAATGDLRHLADQTLLGVAGCVAALGWLQVSPGTAVVLALALAGTAPWALGKRQPAGQTSGPRLVTGRDDLSVPGVSVAGPTPVEPEPARSDAADPDDLGSVGTGELVLAWRRSYAELLGVRSPSQLAALAERRRRLLDELERRDAQGVERWLRSGARAASDPTRFLRHPDGPSAAAA